jgi:solute carrier family 34 (sodium-dependent phosphate cotransporter)
MTPGLRRGSPLPVGLRAALVLFLLYLFLVGIALLEAGIGGLGEGFQAGLLESVSHPLAGLSAGILATVLVQSSSVTTSTIVGMVGAGTLPLAMAVPMVMGANIGTTITNTLASLGTLRREVEFQRAFAAATVHDFFNLLAVLVLLPLELATGILSRTAESLTHVVRGTDFGPGAPGGSPIRAVINLPVGRIEGALEPGVFATAVFLLLGLVLIFLSLALITGNMRSLLASRVEQVMNRVIGRGAGVVGILVGVGVTAAVQSSSITTSILVPLVASGVLSVPNAYPITLGANVGTTVTALIASLAVARPEGLTIALVHLLFNLLGIAILYPVPMLRRVPIRLAEGLAAAAVRRRRVVIAYVVTVFLLLPLAGVLLLG